LVRLPLVFDRRLLPVFVPALNQKPWSYIPRQPVGRPAMSGVIPPSGRSGPSDMASHFRTPLPYEDLAALIEDGLLSRWTFRFTLRAIADKSFAAAHEAALVAVRMADAVLARISDAQADLSAAKWRRFLTSRNVRVVAEGEAAPPSATKVAQLSTIIVSVYLVASIFLMNYTVGQTILAERIFPAVGHSLWKALLVSGVLLSGMLMVPLTLAWCIGSGRLRGLFLIVFNVLAMGCSAWFLSDLWQLHTLTALHAHAVFSGTDLAALADGQLEITRLKGALMILAICGEALGALAVKMNIDHLRAVHNKYKYVANPDRQRAEQDVAAARATLMHWETQYETLVEMDARLKRARKIHRVHCRAYVESVRRDTVVMIAAGIRSLHRQVRRNARDFV
jgi:hypothetical protein